MTLAEYITTLPDSAPLELKAHRFVPRGKAYALDTGEVLMHVRDLREGPWSEVQLTRIAGSVSTSLSD